MNTGNTGKTVLWFLAGCMAFTEAALTMTAKLNDVTSGWVLGFGLLSLIAILTALVIMYKKDPTFLLADSRDVTLLLLIKSMASQNSPELFKQLIEKLTLSSLRGEEEGGEDEKGDEPGEIAEEEVDDEIVREGDEPGESAEEIAQEEVDEEPEPRGDGEDDNEYNKILEELSKGIPGGTNSWPT